MISKSFRKKIGLYDQFSLTLDIEIGQLTQQLKDLVGQKAPKKNENIFKPEPKLLEGIIASNFFEISYGGKIVGKFYPNEIDSTKTDITTEVLTYSFGIVPAIIMTIAFMIINSFFGFIFQGVNFLVLFMIGNLLLLAFSVIVSVRFAPMGTAIIVKREFVQNLHYLTKPENEGIIGDILVNDKKVPIIGKKNLNFKMSYRLEKEDFIRGCSR